MVCPICQRPLTGLIELDQDHHLIPKTFKGKEVIRIHKICHQKIHATFAERELYHWYHTVPRLLEHAEIQKFVKWIANKPIDFYDKNNDTRDRRRKRRR